MGNKINVAVILKDKTQGTKLYNWLYNTNVELDSISTTDKETAIWCTKQKDINTTTHFCFSKLGTMKGCLDGLQILLPSKEMRDWSKFAWKKGDLLVNSCGFQCIFKEWASDDYTKFNGCYSNSRDGYEDVSNAETAKFDKLDNNTAYGYIREIEKRCGGKLNLETLEIEKPEFKNGDIIKMAWDKYSAIVIFWEYSNFGKCFDSHVFFNIKTKIIEYNIHGHILQDTILRLATEEEKKQLFSALEKKGKAWDAEKKQIVDLKPKFDELKPFDKVVVRCSEADRWSIDFFSYKVHNGYICTGDAWFGYCLPYNEETAKLIGTTKDMEV